MASLITLVGIIVVVIGLILYNSFAWGFVVSKFYVWFVLSMFPDLPVINYLQFVGIMIFLGAILPKHSDMNKSETDNTKVVLYIMAPVISLVVGWVFKLLFF